MCTWQEDAREQTMCKLQFNQPKLIYVLSLIIIIKEGTVVV